MRIPQGWDVVDRRAVGPFTTHLTLQRRDGSRLRWSAWRHRKGIGPEVGTPGTKADGRWWAPHGLAWWTSALFVVGSALFAVGSFPPDAARAGAGAGPLFFIGSLFFTGAAYLQYFEATNASDVVADGRRSGKLIGVNAGSAGWWAAAIQLAGTLWFNLSTYEALRSLPTREEEALVWAPDAIGSVCFLIASYLVLLEACGRWWCLRDGSLPWRIAMVNLFGSIAFGVSAVAAYIVPATGQELSPTWANGATFAGAVLFLIGALMPMPLFARARAAYAGG